MATGEETTFRNFTVEQAREYNTSRGRAYPSKLYEHILAYHEGNGGQAKLALDLGCGPGNATRDLSAYFDNIIGLDGSPEMINAARELIPEDVKSKIRFEVVPSEKIHDTPGVKGESVDVITVATAVSKAFLCSYARLSLTVRKVHWFDLPRFYAAAHKVLRPGGTVAIWSAGRPRLRT
jgi:SAM-dependent methyltransferase